MIDYGAGRIFATANYRMRGALDVSRTPRREDMQCGRRMRHTEREGRRNQGAKTNRGVCRADGVVVGVSGGLDKPSWYIGILQYTMIPLCPRVGVITRTNAGAFIIIGTANYRWGGALNASRTPRSADMQGGRCTRRIKREGRSERPTTAGVGRSMRRVRQEVLTCRVDGVRVASSAKG